MTVGKGVLASVGLAAVFSIAAASADDTELDTPSAEPRFSLNELAQRSWADLDCLYRQAEPGRIPCGYADGRAIYCADEPLGCARTRAAKCVWHGKHFHCSEGCGGFCECGLVNQWLGFRAIRAQVFYGPSWLDGKPSIIMDYQNHSRVWADVRDEMREIAPGTYVGAMILRQCPHPKLKLYFVLQTCS